MITEFWALAKSARSVLFWLVLEDNKAVSKTLQVSFSRTLYIRQSHFRTFFYWKKYYCLQIKEKSSSTCCLSKVCTLQEERCIKYLQPLAQWLSVTWVDQIHCALTSSSQHISWFVIFVSSLLFFPPKPFPQRYKCH